jgi:hypothetical protein
MVETRIDQRAGDPRRALLVRLSRGARSMSAPFFSNLSKGHSSLYFCSAPSVHLWPGSGGLSLCIFDKLSLYIYTLIVDLYAGAWRKFALRFFLFQNLLSERPEKSSLHENSPPYCDP